MAAEKDIKLENKAETGSKKDNKNKKKKSKNTIAGKFAAYLSILIFITVLFMTFYGIFVGTSLIEKARADKLFTLKIYAQTIVENHLQDILNGKYDGFNKVISNLMNKKQILNAYIINKETKLIKYSTTEGLAGRVYDQNSPEDYALLRGNTPVIYQPKGVLEILYYNLTFSKLNNPIFTSFIELPNMDIVAITMFVGNLSQVTTIYKGYVVLALMFLFLSFMSAVVLAKMVTKPISELLEGVKRFAKRDFTFRLPVESDDEIGQLAQSVNSMAEELEESYKYLEQKVKERTKELQQKKDEVEIQSNEIAKAYSELKEAQVKLVHSEKMSSLGQLVAGVAHELNNPINFIYGNMEHLKGYTDDLKNIIDKYESYESSLKDGEKQVIQDLKEDVDYEYLLDDLDDLLASCKEGAERTRQIVLDLRNFSRLDEANLKEVCIHEGIDSTLNILHNKYKNRVEILKDYDPDMPMVTCLAGQINQVFMNLLANAAQAIDDKGEVKICTRNEGEHVTISISDSGCGISEENLSKIFDPFFTTKDVGEGTGLGLSVSYGIIEKHNGTISVDSKVGEGTTFTVKIPVKWTNNQE